MAKGWKKANSDTSHPSYWVWNQMIQRCCNPSNRAYDRYGGRGITVCDKWKSWKGFFEDMGDPPDGLTLDRIDNSKGYYKENCQWATPTEQNENRRNTRRITFRGKTQSLKAWSRELGIGYLTLYSRIVRDGWSEEEAFVTPVDTSKRNRLAGGAS